MRALNVLPNVRNLIMTDEKQFCKGKVYDFSHTAHNFTDFLSKIPRFQNFLKKPMEISDKVW